MSPSASRDIRASRYIMAVVSVTAFVGSLFNCSILCVSTVEGTWILGEVFCQIFALISYSLVTCAIWLTALAAFERYYKLLSPTDHSAMFSEINTRILVVGVIFIAVALCTAPLYGWGEYSNYKGAMSILMSLSSELHLERSNLGNDTHRDGEYEIHEAIPVNYSAKLMTGQFLCSRRNDDESNLDLLIAITSSFIGSKFDLSIRKTSSSCQVGKILFILRANNKEAVDEVLRGHLNGLLRSDISKSVVSSFKNITNLDILLSVQLDMNIEAITEYREIYVPFQGIGICSLDFTDVNTHMLSSVLYIIGTTMLIPYIVILVCGIGVVRKYHSGRLHNHLEDYTYLKILYICGFTSMVFCVPYYATNFLNASGLVISVGANFFSTMLFYMTPMCVAGPYVFCRLTDMNISQKLLFTRKKTTLGSQSDETLSSAIRLETL
ncbi:Octopamine receptor 1 [Mizuhopecten yessoensis]|uniref:Octopamine receptor 1 n=1 Tax=Mizuhopecten yessoensis TaxID=6573 RepID=A0A210PV60_MIZYE|nr:Octopamine receptor 1 [Mizuhopecten yessoensis]